MRHLSLLIPLAFFFGCDRTPPIEKALPSTASKVTVTRTEVVGSPEGDATVRVGASFPDAAACQAFIDGYAPREKLIRDPSGIWSRDSPGRERCQLSCAGADMRYQNDLY